MMMMMINCFCGMVDRRKAFSLISSRDHCQRSSPSRISDTPRAGWMVDVGRCKQTIIITDVNFIRSISSHPSKKTQKRQSEQNKLLEVTAEHLLCCSYKYLFLSIICALFFLQREFEISLMPFCVQNWSFCCCLYDKDITLKLRKRVLRGFQMVPQ